MTGRPPRPVSGDRSVQATVTAFDSATGAGAAVTDTGAVLRFDSAAFARSGLCSLRPGQRVRCTLDERAVPIAVTVWTLPAPGAAG